MTEQDLRSSADIFEKRAIEFDKINHAEADALLGDLIEWGSSVPGNKGLDEIVSSQIDHAVRKLNSSGEQITAEEFVESLFSPNAEGKITADIIMARLQLA